MYNEKNEMSVQMVKFLVKPQGGEAHGGSPTQGSAHEDVLGVFRHKMSRPESSIIQTP